MSTHGECANFSNGWCQLKNIPVNAGDPACPSFTPRLQAQIQRMGLLPRILVQRIPKAITDVYEELEELGFAVRWVIPSRSFVVAGGTLRYTGLKNGHSTYLTNWLLAR